MKELEYLILGFVHIKVDHADFYKAATLFLGKGIRAFSKKNGEYLIFYSQWQKTKELLQKAKINYSTIKEFNLLHFEKNKINASAIISAFVFTVIFVIFLSNMVWRIEIIGCQKTEETDIRSMLEECGLAVGTIWKSIDYGDIENKVLEKNREVAWININRVGTVAYVSIIEAETPSAEDETYTYSNIVANEDCVVESISVTTGTPMVKIGDAVTKGDLLILGMVESESGSVPCRASGMVIGRINKSISVSVDRNQHKKTEEYKVLSLLKIKIFNFYVNIFKKYGNFGYEYVIIEENEVISLFGKADLPVFLEKQYSVKYKNETQELSDDDLVLRARELMQLQIEDILAQVRLNSIKTYGNFTDKGYVMSTDMVYLCDVGNEVSFSISKGQR